MRITNFGSCCIDNVYQVPHFVRPGETLPCTGYEIHPGGKGLNQSLALAYAGADVRHAGMVGAEGQWMRDLLADAGVDTIHLRTTDQASGHAIIQVTPEGENSIVIFGGANRLIDVDSIETVLADSESGEYLLIQNEISCLPELIRAASNKGLRIICNAAPMTESVQSWPLELIEMFIVNEVEGEALTGEAEPEKILAVMLRKFPKAKIILTLGKDGVMYADAGQRYTKPAYPVTVVDTTAAGDTFTGYFLAGFVKGDPVETCLEHACRAAAVCVTRPGAASSIPRREDLR